ncbi:MAG: hypothetical protein PHZ27_03665, partial [Candidatus Omnitrophica bacterium]|nr:hypothetical protein [Candidatus Omnitrophota bacterium]
ISAMFSNISSATVFGMAIVDLYAQDNISLSNAYLRSLVNGDGVALTFLSSNGGDITVAANSNLIADVNGNGHAEVSIDTAGIRAMIASLSLSSLSYSDLVALYNAFIATSGNVNITDSSILAQSGASNDTALIDIIGYNINVNNSAIEAEMLGDGVSAVALAAVNDINVTDSLISAVTNGNGTSVTLAASKEGDVNIDTAEITAETKGDGESITAVGTFEGNVNVKSSTVSSLAGGDGISITAVLSGEGDIVIDDSIVSAESKDGELAIAGVATFDGDVDIINGSTVSSASDSGIAITAVFAEDNVTIDATSAVTAESNDNIAAALVLAGDNLDAQGLVSALSVNSYALAALLALGNVNALNVFAQGSSSVDVVPYVEDIVSSLLGGMPISIGIQNTYSSGAVIGSLDGDVTLGSITADMVLAAAMGYNSSDGSIFDADGDVNAKFAYLIASNDIGTALNPITTNVDILAGYSGNMGDIYISEANDIELGAYIPIFDENDDQIAALGLSLAANDGIISVTSGGDMTVNSVVSPLGGVYLGSTNGSIYAGRGWCPVVSQSDLDWLASNLGMSSMPSMVNELLMDVSGTPWGTVGGVEYFSPVMFGITDLPEGPNVIAGSYSYFSTPNGTIGIGSAGEALTSTNWYNPLSVNIQLVDDDSDKWAVPTGFTPVAGLTLNIGSDTNTLYGFTFDGANGPLGLSGAIEGIVRPGVISINNDSPTPAIDHTSKSPSGYVYYDDTDVNCVSPLDGSVVDPLGPIQIWPELPVNANQYLADALNAKLRIYYEVANSVRLSTAYAYPGAGQILTSYAYHPLTETDSSAFDDISLDVNAYQFIEDNIKLKKDLNSFYGWMDGWRSELDFI